MNRFALSLLRVFKKPIPDVFRDEVMNPIGASTTWKWVPYTNAYVDIDGKRMASVVGRHALGRRHVDQQLRHGAVRVAVAEERQVGRPADCAAGIRQDGDDAEPARTGLWIPVVAEHEAGAMARLAGRRVQRARAAAATSSSSRRVTISSWSGAGARSRTRDSSGSSPPSRADSPGE